MRSTVLIGALLFSTSQGVACVAAITYSVAGSTYTQNFNSPTLEADNIDDGVAFTNDTTITGWHLFTVTSGSDATPVAAGSYDTHTGGATAAAFYSFGTPDGNADRALGAIGGNDFYSATSIANGAVAGWIAASISNATGASLGEFTLSFNGEQWRRGGSNTTPSTMVFEYGFGSTFSSVSIWTAPGGNFDWTTPVIGAGDANTLNGNVEGLVSGRGGTITGLNWTDSTTLWLRWLETNDAGSDHGMAIDAISFSAIPEPRAALFGCLVCSVIGSVAIGKRLFGKLNPKSAT